MKNRVRVLLIGALLLSSSYLFAQSTKDALDAYVERLKTSQATGGSETAFLSVGSAFLAAQEYFEAGNYASAEYSFASVVRAHKNHAFANYQLAVALILQNETQKAKLAQEYLQHAFALNPELKKRYLQDVPQHLDEKEAPSPEPELKGLDAYLEGLKRSQAMRGAETAMNTVGSDVMYGYEYYETGNYSGAATYFRLALGKEPNNAHVNYLMAVALTLQGEQQAAQSYLAKSVEQLPELRERYIKDTAGAHAILPKPVPAKPATPAPANPKPQPKGTGNSPGKSPYGGKLVYGNYVCEQSVWRGPNMSPAYRYDYKGYIALKKDGTYRWLDDGGTGRYRYDAATGVITWLSGPMKSQAPKSTKYQPGTTVAQISVSFSEYSNWQCGCNKK
jgi:tetratricopeptide (TPR) repeat protein